MDRDKTGPEGKGPMTGRGRGFCINFEVPEMEFQQSNMNFPRDFNKVLERGFGRGFGLRIQPRELTKEEKVSFLKNEKKFLEEKVLRVGEQLKDFEKPLGKTKNKPLMKDFKNKPLKKVVSKNKRVKK